MAGEKDSAKAEKKEAKAEAKTAKKKPAKETIIIKKQPAIKEKDWRSNILLYAAVAITIGIILWAVTILLNSFVGV